MDLAIHQSLLKLGLKFGPTSPFGTFGLQRHDPHR
jgi:hypothetical protein